MSVTTIIHRGKKVIFIDYSKVKSEEEALETLYRVKDMLMNSSEKVLKLNNVEGAFATPKFMSEAKRLNKEILDAKTHKGAVIGINALQGILLKGFNVFSTQKLVPFMTKEAALNYLTA